MVRRMSYDSAVTLQSDKGALCFTEKVDGDLYSLSRQPAHRTTGGGQPHNDDLELRELADTVPVAVRRSGDDVVQR